MVVVTSLVCQTTKKERKRKKAKMKMKKMLVRSGRLLCSRRKVGSGAGGGAGGWLVSLYICFCIYVDLCLSYCCVCIPVCLYLPVSISWLIYLYRLDLSCFFSLSIYLYYIYTHFSLIPQAVHLTSPLFKPLSHFITIPHTS